MNPNIWRSFLFAVLLAGFAVLSNAAEKGLLWKAESPSGNVSYMFGTMHTDDRRVTDFSPQLLEAVKNSDAFFMEILPASDPAIYLMRDKSLQDLLTPEELEKVRELAEYHVLHFDAVKRMKPWLLAILFDLPKPKTPFAMDTLLMHQADSMGKKILGLEDAQAHFGVMDSFSLEEQLTMLRVVLKRTQQEKERDFEQLISAYLDGDADAIATMDAKITGDGLPKELWDKLRVKLLDERNAAMAARVVEEAGWRNIFVAVGAAHLAGENGLLAGLKAAGFKLQPVR